MGILLSGFFVGTVAAFYELGKTLVAKVAVRKRWEHSQADQSGPPL
jgi:hypothetical protein